MIHLIVFIYDRTPFHVCSSSKLDFRRAVPFRFQNPQSTMKPSKIPALKLIEIPINLGLT